jgi:uncharacterized membrane protein
VYACCELAEDVRQARVHWHDRAEQTTPPQQRDRLVSRIVKGAGPFLAAVGVTHFLVPGYYRSLVPGWIDSRGLEVAISGAVEIALGLAVILPATRVLGARAAAALITAYLTVHIDALGRARSHNERFLERPLGAILRLIVNLGYIGWAVAVALADAR